MNKTELNELRRLYHEVDHSSWQKGFDPAYFKLVLQCLCRTPFASYARIKEFITTIKEMTDSGQDYSLLLKAGILTGQFPDYKSYKRQKYNDYKKNRQLREVENQLEQFKLELKLKDAYIERGTLLIQVDVSWWKDLNLLLYRWLNDSKNKVLYEKKWKLLTQEQKNIAGNFSPAFLNNLDYDKFSIDKTILLNEIAQKECDKIKQLLSLNPEEWSYTCEVTFEQPVVIISHASIKEFDILSVKNDNPYDSDAADILLGNKSLVVYEHIEQEKMNFISIYQNHLFSKHQNIGDKLERYFMETHRGQTPEANELTALRRRYYRFIRKTYATQMSTDDLVLEKPIQKAHALAPIYPGKNNVFNLFHGKKDGKINAGTLLFDVKKECYYLLAGAELPNAVNDIADCGIAEFISKNNTLRKLESGGYRVIKKTVVHSSSQAAWLICGYKRNGLDCWKNAKGKTLRQFLAELKECKNKISSKS